MGGFYKPYPKEFYVLNDLLPKHFIEDQPHLMTITIDYRNRCFNYNAIDPARKRFSDEIYGNVINCLKEDKILFLHYIEKFFPEHQREQYKAVVDRFTRKDPRNPTNEDRVELHYHLVDLYHSFPNHPGKHLDGIMRKIGTQLARMGLRFRYVTIDLLPQNKCPYPEKGLPWAQMRFYGYGDVDKVIMIPLDLPGQFSEEIIANQEDLRILERCPDRIPNEEKSQTGDAERQKQREDDDPSSIFFYYLFPLFFDPKFEGKRRKESVTGFPFWSFIVFPVYSAELAGEGCYGTIIGHLYLSFPDENDRVRYLKGVGGEPNTSWDTLAMLISRTLLEGRSYSVVEEDVRPNESLKDLMASIGHHQDWEKVFVFANALDAEPEFCYKRTPGQEKGHVDYGHIWVICEKEKDCKDCDEGFYEKLIHFIHGHGNENAQTFFDHKNTFCDQDTGRYFFIQKLGEIMDLTILPAIEVGDIERYKQYILVFEFPEYTFYPTKRNSKDRAINDLGEHYLKKLISIFDRILMKRKVLNQSIKSAVAAIISRNHSHHIGSHVTPRCSLEKVMDRLNHLGYQETSFEKKIRIAGILKSRLDQYIQKKADFLSEIVTEPLTSTRTLGFFNEVILPLVENTLLMDNIGANEGVNYQEGRWNDNRLKIHAYFDGSELKARMYGGDRCSCNNICNTTDYAYSGHCKCSTPRPLQVLEPESSDISVALPGPLGEFAIYAFLENFIRNAVKHNQESFRKDLALCLDVHIKVSELPDDDAERDDFYRVEVWEDITRPSVDLIESLKGYIDEPVVDRYGQLRKGAWGIAEMKIMANLLRGSDNFSTMGSSLQVHGHDRLIYEFRIMKARKIAVISKRFPLSDDHIKKGIRSFPSFEDLVKYQKEARSLAGFNFSILDRDAAETKEDYTHFLPNRVFIHQDLNIRIPGALEIDDRFMELIRERDAGNMISFVWQRWIKRLPFLSDQEKRSRVTLFFGQEEDSAPSSDWLKFARQWERSENKPKLSIIFQGEDKNEVSPAIPAGEGLAVFDRHFDGFDEDEYGALRENASISFHEAFDKNSSDFVPIFSARPSDLMIYQLAESALMKVLVLDERIAEVAYEEIFRDEANKPLYVYNSKQRTEVCRWGNIYVATHLKIDEETVKTLHHSIKNDFPQVLVETNIGKPDGKRIDEFNVYWIFQGKNGALMKHKIRPHIIIMHQGVLETFFGEKIPRNENESFVQALKSFVYSIRDFIPFVVVDSGRGIPANLPPDVKFVPFSLIQEFFMQERISKYSLIKTLMGLIRRGNP